MEAPTTLRRLLDSALVDLEGLQVPAPTLMKLLQASALVRSEELRLAELYAPESWPKVVVPEQAMSAVA